MMAWGDVAGMRKHPHPRGGGRQTRLPQANTFADGGDMSKRTCRNPACGKPLTRRDGENATDWKHRKFCDRACSAARRTHDAQVRLPTYSACVVCGVHIAPRQRADGRGVYRTSKTCQGPECIAECKRRAVRAGHAKRRAGTNKPGAWKDPAGNIHNLTGSDWYIAEYKASVLRRLRKGEPVAMTGNERLFDAAPTQAAA